MDRPLPERKGSGVGDRRFYGKEGTMEYTGVLAITGYRHFEAKSLKI